MADLREMENEINELSVEIGLSVPRLQQLLEKDERYIGQLVSLGRSRDFAEKASFIGDLRNVLGLMASHGFSAHTAARLIGQTPENPVEISTTEDEDDEENEEQPQQHENEAPSSQDEESVYPCSSGSSCVKSLSVTSSEDDDTVEAKRLKVDPDYRPSETSGTTTPATTTASNSQLASEEELEVVEETTESESESFVPDDTTDEELEIAEEEEEENL
jgi:hypothetical protein